MSEEARAGLPPMREMTPESFTAIFRAAVYTSEGQRRHDAIAADRLRAALCGLPVEQRMEAMGMKRCHSWGTCFDHYYEAVE